MFRTIRTTLLAAAVAAGGAFASDSADAQWGYYGPSYYGPSYGGSSFYFGFSTGPRYSYYAPSYGYGYGVRPYDSGRYDSGRWPGSSWYNPVYGGYGSVYGAPRGRLEYDVYTPFGRREVEYRFRRDGSVRFDVDD